VLSGTSYLEGVGEAEEEEAEEEEEEEDLLCQQEGLQQMFPNNLHSPSKMLK